MADPVTPITSLLERMRFDESTATAFVSQDWLQGRATFGGLLAALCLEAANRAFGDLPPSVPLNSPSWVRQAAR